MFTGITRGVFPASVSERRQGFMRYSVALSDELRQGLELGASVSIDGVCQTVVAIAGEHVSFEAIAETLSRSTLTALSTGDQVSVERSATMGTELGGHVVAGHVWGTAVIEEIIADHERQVHDLCLGVPTEWMKYLMPKGFIAVDGSSLTIGVCQTTASGGRFSVHLIPETLRLTRLGQKSVGERVNVELDPQTVAIVETVERVLAQRGHA